MFDFARNLADFAASAGKSHVIILSSLDSGRKKMMGSSRCLPTWVISLSKCVFFSLHIIMISCSFNI